MPIRTIIVPLTGREDEMAALRTGLQLAQVQGARLEALHVSPDPYTAIQPYLIGYLGPDYPQQIISDFMKGCARTRRETEEKFLQAAEEAKVPITADEDSPAAFPSAAFCWLTGDIEQILPARSRLADLVVMRRSSDDSSESDDNMAYGALFESGRPVLFVPPGQEARPVGKKVLIAWNGSVEATRAVNLALPLLAGAKVLAWSGQEGKELLLPPSDLARYLGRHGIAAEFATPDISGKDAQASLTDTAAAFGADLIVMGAYTHSRLRETILGGLTDDMFSSSPIPVLMAH